LKVGLRAIQQRRTVRSAQTTRDARRWAWLAWRSRHHPATRHRVWSNGEDVLLGGFPITV